MKFNPEPETVTFRASALSVGNGSEAKFSSFISFEWSSTRKGFENFFLVGDLSYVI